MRRRIYARKDSDYTTFIEAAGITDSIQKKAIKDLIASLKMSGLWDKMVAIYPFIGGTANTHKYNLIDVSEHTISWGSGVTHSANGVITNYSKNNLNLSKSASSVCMGAYIANNVSNQSVDIGPAVASTSVDRFLCHIKYLDGITYFDCGYSASDGRLSCTISDIRGLISFNRMSNMQYVYKNNTLITSRKNSLNITINNLYLNGGNDAGNTFVNDRQYRFVFISEGLSATEISNLYSIVQTFQTTLNRAV